LNSLFFGIKIDEYIDICVTSHLIVFATFIEEGLHITVFLGLLEIEVGKYNVIVIFDCLINHLKNWGLELCKFVVFSY